MSLLYTVPLSSFATATATTTKLCSPVQCLEQKQKPSPTISFFASPKCVPFSSSPITHTHQTKLSTRTCATQPSSNIAFNYPMCETVEHIVLFKMKPNTDQDIVIQQLNLLKNLPGVIYLTSGYVQGMYASNGLEYTIFLHSRHRNKQDLDIYMHNPAKAKFTNTYTELYYEDYAVIDWATHHQQPLDCPTIGNAIRSTFFQMKDEGWGSVSDVIGTALGNTVAQQTFGQSYVGKTYRPQDKAFTIASLGVYLAVFQMDAVGTPEEFGKKIKAEVKGAIDNIMVVDYIVNEVYVSSNYGTI